MTCLELLGKWWVSAAYTRDKINKKAWQGSGVGGGREEEWRQQSARL